MSHSVEIQEIKPQAEQSLSIFNKEMKDSPRAVQNQLATAKEKVSISSSATEKEAKFKSRTKSFSKRHRSRVPPTNNPKQKQSKFPRAQVEKEVKVNDAQRDAKKDISPVPIPCVADWSVED